MAIRNFVWEYRASGSTAGYADPVDVVGAPDAYCPKSDPVLGSDPWHTDEFAHVVGDDNQPFFAPRVVVRLPSRESHISVHPLAPHALDLDRAGVF
jgi:hypothetical protein